MKIFIAILCILFYAFVVYTDYEAYQTVPQYKHKIWRLILSLVLDTIMMIFLYFAFVYLYDYLIMIFKK